MTRALLPLPLLSSRSVPKFAYFNKLHHAIDTHQTFPTTWKLHSKDCRGTKKRVQLFFFSNLTSISFLSFPLPYICSVLMASWVCWYQKHLTSVPSTHCCLMLLLQQVLDCPDDLTLAKCDLVRCFTETSVNGPTDMFSFISKHFLVHNRRKYCFYVNYRKIRVTASTHGNVGT